MRRYVLIIAVLLLGSAVFARETEPAAEQQNWTNQVLGSVSAPFADMNWAAGGNACAGGVYGNLSYIGTSFTGFTVKADAGSGVVFSNAFQTLYATDMPLCYGWGATARIGAGYSIVHTQRLQVAALAAVNLDYLLFTYNKTIVSYANKGDTTDSHSSTQTQTDNMLMYGFGAELYACYRITDKIGFFADVNVSFPDYGRQWISGTYMDKSYSSEDTMRGTIAVLPAVGVSLTF